MKTAIFYFTGTGNNLRTAEKLKEELGETVLFPFHHLKENKKIDPSFTHLIFCVPSYYSHIPPFVRECLENVEFTKTQQIVTIVGCAGNRGRATEDIRECIEACGKKVAGEYMIVYPGSYILSYSAFPQLYQKLVNQHAEKKIIQIAKAIKEKHLTTLKKTGIFYSEKYEEQLQEAIQSFSERGSQYEVAQSCMGCGICEKVCPVHNIHLENKKPVFADQCQQCMACVQWCPNKAIDYMGKAYNRKRYHHEAIKVQDVIKANTEK